MPEINNDINPNEKLVSAAPFFISPRLEKAFRTDELTQDVDWSLRNLRVPLLWSVTGGDGINVAILDSGVKLDHPDIKDSIVCRKNFIEPEKSVSDEHGHGTHVAGIVAARNNNQGYVGVAPNCNLLIGKVLNSENLLGSPKELANAIHWAIDNKADIINLSLVIALDFESVHEAIVRAYENNICVVAAAPAKGRNPQELAYPAQYDETIAVGSTGFGGNRSHFSGEGEKLDIVAPGENIWSTWSRRYLYNELSGTSQACAFVSGVVALMLAKHRKYPTISETPIGCVEDVKQHLREISIDSPHDLIRGFDPKYGWGLIQPDMLLDERLTSLNLQFPNDLSTEAQEKATTFINMVNEQYPGTTYLEGTLRNERKEVLGVVVISNLI
ncbi:MAG: S8 family peptidase [Cyclobacteriaceae bacterium]